MLKSIFYIIQLALLIFIAVWLADNPGTVKINWMNYNIEIHTGIFTAIFLSIIIISMILYRIWRNIISIPKTYKSYKKHKNLIDGYEAISMGIAAIAAGDSKRALSYSNKAKEIIPDSGKGLILLLEAQSKRMNNQDDVEVTKIYEELANSKDMALLGVRGLVNNAMEHGDYSKALELAEKSYKANKKQVWLLKQIYTLQIHLGLWNEALKSLNKSLKVKATDKSPAYSDKASLLILLADKDIQEKYIDDAISNLKKSLKINAGFSPAAQRLSKIYIERGRRKAAINVIEKAWKIQPHPDLVPLWNILFISKKTDNSIDRLKWFEKLCNNNPNSAESQITLATIAISENLWGAAKSALKLAETIRPSSRLYRLWAELEEKSFKDTNKINKFLEKASLAEPDKIWVCKETGNTYNNWEAIAQPHKSFNTIIWDLQKNHLRMLGDNHSTELLL